MEVLQKIQTELKAPKGQYNKFGNYKYRSCEDILEAVKPILAKYGAVITLSDDIASIDGRFYVKATARMIADSKVLAEVSAFAREPEDKKGMDASQITGTASSYARKYALNGLLLIDDTKDEDTDECREEKQAREEEKKAATSKTQKKNQEPPKDNVKSEEDMKRDETEKISDIHLKAVRDRIKAAAEKGKRLEEADVCKMLKIEKFEDMNYVQFRWLNEMLEKNGV